MSYPPPGDQTRVSHTAGRFFTVCATTEAQGYGSGWRTPSPGDLPDPGIEPGSPALQVDSLSTEVPGKPLKTKVFLNGKINKHLDLSC